MEGLFILGHDLRGFSPSWQRACEGKTNHIMVAREGREAREEGRKVRRQLQRGKDGGWDGGRERI